MSEVHSECVSYVQLGHVTVVQGGVLPHIHSSLLPSEGGAKRGGKKPMESAEE